MARRTERSSSRIGLRASIDWVRVLSLPGASSANRGAPIVRALQAGITATAKEPPDIVVNVDADISMDSDYFERLLERFDADPALGIASGSAFEFQRGAWRQRHVTGTTVWGASRAYRWECLQEILPLEERVGWDGLDEFKANARGWRTTAFEELPFRHHRRKESATVRPGRRAGIRGARRTTSAIDSGISCSVPCGSPAESRPPSRWSGDMRQPLCAGSLGIRMTRLAPTFGVNRAFGC